MASRAASRVAILARAVARRAGGGRRARPEHPRRILVAHHLLLGDTLMLTATLARLRHRYPDADIAMALPAPFASLYESRPYGVRALGWNPRDIQSVRRLLEERAFDLALIPGDNRHAWLAQAMGARWIVAFDGDRPAWKSWPVDELHDYPATPGSWSDITAALAGGEEPPPFHPRDWPGPESAAFAAPGTPYAMLHVGASSPLKLWKPAQWQALASLLRDRGLGIAWSAGRGEEALVTACGPAPGDVVTAGRLDLAQLWRLAAGAALIVCPDTGVAHLGRIVGTPTIALFGPGSARLAGAGRFWRDAPYRALVIDPFPCRDQHVLFKREVAWVTICKRSLAECPAPRCMHALDVDMVAGAANDLMASTVRPTA